MSAFSVFKDTSCGGGKAVCQKVEYSGLDGFVDAIENKVPSVSNHWNPWWSAHEFTGGYRSQKNWRSSSIVVFDLDYYDDNGVHASIPDHVQALVLGDFLSSANVFHFTPRGVRVLFVLDRTIANSDEYLAVAEGARVLVQEWLDRLGLSSAERKSCLVIDATVYKDLGRLVYPPSARINGEVRNYKVFRGDGLVCADDLKKFAPVVEQQPPVAPVIPLSARSVASKSFEEALREYNMAHTRDWGRAGSGRCPAHPDKGSACFGALPDSPGRWFCFSDHHPEGCGRKAEKGGYCGDAADIDAFLSGVSVSQLVLGRESLGKVALDGAFQSWLDRGEGRSGKTNGGDGSQRSDGRFVFIRRPGEEHDAVDFAERTLAELGVYNRGGALCRVLAGGSIALLTHSDAQTLLGSAVSWRVPVAKDATKPWDPTRDFARLVVDRSSFSHVKPLDYVTTAPLVQQDGSIFGEPGYNDRVVFDANGVDWGELPSSTSHEEALACRDRLLGVVSEFPFASDVDKSVWLAGLLTPVCRRLFSGNTPMFMFTATTPGSGKTLLVQTISTILSGSVPPPVPFTSDSAEFQKTVFSQLLSGAPLTLFDDLSGELASHVLQAVLTCGGVYSGRVLGASKVAGVPVNTVFFATGNNLTPGGDLYRRALLCRLEPKVENPEYRTGFRIKNLLGYVAAHRTDLYLCAARMIQAWIQAGRPEVKDRAIFGSFEEWSVVRDILGFCGLPDPLSGTVNQEVSREKEALSLLLGGLGVAYPSGQPFTVFDMVNAAEAMRESCREYPSQLEKSGFGSVLEACALRGALKRNEVGLDPVKVGNWFRAVVGRVVGGVRLERVGKSGGNRVLWRVVFS